MGREIKYIDYPITLSTKLIEAEIQHYVSCRCIEEGGSGLINSIRWIDKTFSNYDEARNYIDRIDSGNYDQIAVKYLVYSNIKPSTTLNTLLQRLDAESKKKTEYAKAHSVSAAKAAYIGCPNCGSRLKKELLRSEHCPLCRTDLRSDATINKLNELQEKINELNMKIAEERKKLEAKNRKGAKEHWLVKIEFHQ